MKDNNSIKNDSQAEDENGAEKRPVSLVHVERIVMMRCPLTKSSVKPSFSVRQKIASLEHELYWTKKALAMAATLMMDYSKLKNLDNESWRNLFIQMAKSNKNK